MLQNDLNENQPQLIEEKDQCMICRNLFLKGELKEHQAICMNNLSNNDQEYLDEQLAQLIIDENCQSSIFTIKRTEKSQQKQKISLPLQQNQTKYVIDYQQINNKESNDIQKELVEQKKINENPQKKNVYKIKFLNNICTEQAQSLIKQQQQDLQKCNPEHKNNENNVIEREQQQNNGSKEQQQNNGSKEQKQIYETKEQQQNNGSKEQKQIYEKKEQQQNNGTKEQYLFDIQNNSSDQNLQDTKILPQTIEIQSNFNQSEDKDQINNSTNKINNSQEQNINNLKEKNDSASNHHISQMLLDIQQGELQDEIKTSDKFGQGKKKSVSDIQQLQNQKNFLKFTPVNFLQSQQIPSKREAYLPQNLNRNPPKIDQGQFRIQEQKNPQEYANQQSYDNYPQLHRQQQKKKFEFKPGMRLSNEEANKLSKEELYEYFTQVDLENQVGYQSKIFKLEKKRVQINETDQCIICQEDIQPSKEAIDIQLDCKHQFHFDCIKQWLQKQKNCPICKGHVDLCFI